MPAVDGAYYGPHFPMCYGCMQIIRSCGANRDQPDQPLKRFILPYSAHAAACSPVYYHVNCEAAQVTEYQRLGWYADDILWYFQTDRRTPPVTVDSTGSSSSDGLKRKRGR